MEESPKSVVKNVIGGLLFIFLGLLVSANMDTLKMYIWDEHLSQFTDPKEYVFVIAWSIGLLVAFVIIPGRWPERTAARIPEGKLALTLVVLLGFIVFVDQISAFFVGLVGQEGLPARVAFVVVVWALAIFIWWIADQIKDWYNRPPAPKVIEPAVRKTESDDYSCLFYSLVFLAIFLSFNCAIAVGIYVGVSWDRNSDSSNRLPTLNVQEATTTPTPTASPTMMNTPTEFPVATFTATATSVPTETATQIPTEVVPTVELPQPTYTPDTSDGGF